jgi:hypothetical protein
MSRRPPEILERFITRMIPQPCRENVAGDLREQCQSARQYLRRAIRIVPRVIAGRLWRNLDPAILVIEACGVFMAFGAAWRLSDMPLVHSLSELTRLLIPAGAALIGLALRDAYVDHENRNPPQSAVDAVFGATFSIAINIIFDAVVPALSLPGTVIAKQALITVFIVSIVRMSFWGMMRPSKEGMSLPDAAIQFDKRRRGRNLSEYAVALFILIVFGSNAIREPNPLARILLSSLIIATFVVVFRLHKWNRKLSADLTPEEYREAYRQQLTQQRDVTYGAWKWLSLMFVPMVIMTFVIPAPPASLLELRSMGLATFTLCFALVAKLNRVVARKLTQRLESLDSLELQQ